MRLTGFVLGVALLVAGGLAGCSSESVPPGPTASQLPGILSRAQGYGANGYANYDVNFVRFISDAEWPTVMTNCLEAQGVTTVDFRLMQPGPYTYPVDPHGSAVLSRALGACALEYPSQALAGEVRTRAQWAYEYSYLSKEFSACVRAAGGSVSGLPSRKDYLTTAVSTTGVPSAFSYVFRSPGGAPLSVIKARCPATAPGL